MERWIRIKANYSFWHHPIQWLRERKMRKILEKMANRVLTPDELYNRMLDQAMLSSGTLLYGLDYGFEPEDQDED